MACFRRGSGAAILLGVMGLLLTGSLPPAYARGGPPPRGWVALPHSAMQVDRAARALGALPASRPVSFAVGLRPRNGAGMDALLARVYDPASPLYHHWLSVSQFAARFAPSLAERGGVVRWLSWRGLHVTGMTRNGLLIHVVGTATDVERAFHTRLLQYRLHTRTFFANAGPVQVPVALEPAIATVSGLNTAHQFRPDTLHLRSVAHADGSDALGPQDVQSAYNLASVYARGITGGEHTIALFEMTDFTDSYVDTYSHHFGLHTGQVDRVPVSDGSTTATDLKNEGEAELDIDMVHAVAPQAHVLVYEAPNTEAGFLAVWNRIASDNRADVVATSWSDTESAFPSQDVASIDAALKEAALQGQSVFTSSGDYGAYSDPSRPTALTVRFPGSDPWVTSVGGTILAQNLDGSWQEYAWSNPGDEHGPSGGGGGLSTLFGRPSWQVGPGVDESYSNGMRQMPDVSANAGAPYAVYTVDDAGNADWYMVYGTSASSPLWASVAVLADQQAGGRLGFFSPMLYALGARAASLQQQPFHDVTQGNNLYYHAGPGWDFASGWGSPNVDGLLADLGLVSNGPLATATGVPPATVATGLPAATAPVAATVTPTVPAPTPTPTPRPATPTSTPAPRVSVHLDRVVVINSHGKQATAFKAGERVRIQITYTVMNARGMARIMVTRTYLHNETGHWRQWGKPVTATVRAGNGSHHFNRYFRLPRTWGLFRIRVNLHAGGTGTTGTVTVRITGNASEA